MREKSSQQIHSLASKKKRSLKMSGDKNPMYGKSFYDVWVDKYGEEGANKKLRDYKAQKSVRNSGANNPMYGRPSPKGSGNGWSGWYKGWYFRSLRELSYVINHLEKKSLKWESAEKKKFSIAYKDWDGTDKTYRPDFFVENKQLIEIKPERLRRTITVKLKQKAAEVFCKKSGYKYIIIEPVMLKDEEIKKLYQDGVIIFTERYKKKFEEKYL